MINFFGHGAFPSAVWWKWRLGCCLFLVFSLRFFGCGRRRETRFGFFCVAPQVALQTEISHADRDFSLAVAVLHAFDVASLPLQHQKAKGGVFARIRWRRSRCNIKRSGGLSLSSAKRLLCGSTGDLCCFFFFFGGFSVPGSLCVCKSLADRHLSLSRSRLLPCTRCSARSGRARRSRCKMQMSEGGFCRSAALRDCWLLELTSELFSCVFGLFSFRLFLFFFFGCGILSLSSAKRLLAG